MYNKYECNEKVLNTRIDDCKNKELRSLWQKTIPMMPTACHTYALL